MLAEFRPDEREERGAALVDLLNLVVTQVLVPAPRGGRTAIREWLVFEPDMKGELLDAPIEKWAAMVGRYLRERGQTLGRQAERAFEAGRIRIEDRRRLVAQSEEARA